MPEHPGPDTPQPGAAKSPAVHMSRDGLLEESPTSASQSWTQSPLEEDPRSLAELAEDVMRAAAEMSAAEESASVTETGVGEAEADEREVTPQDEGGGDELGGCGPPVPRDEASSRGGTPLIVLIILLFVAGAGVLALGPGIGTSSEDAEGSGDAAAAVTNDKAATESSPAPSSGVDPAAAVTASDTPSPEAPKPTPTAAPQKEPVAEPSPDPIATPSPVPTAPPAPTVTPTPNPTEAPAPTAVPPPEGIHVADLVPTIREVGKNVKVTVEVHVHDFAHNPVIGATVRGQWTDGGESASCVTGPGGSCAASIGPLGRPRSVTFTVAEVAYEGEAYVPALNHDADGDSNGTSITVTF